MIMPLDLGKGMPQHLASTVVGTTLTFRGEIAWLPIRFRLRAWQGHDHALEHAGMAMQLTSTAFPMCNDTTANGQAP